MNECEKRIPTANRETRETQSLEEKAGNCSVRGWCGENRMQCPASVEREKTYVQANERGAIEKPAVRNEVGMSIAVLIKVKRGRNYGPMEETYYS